MVPGGPNMLHAAQARRARPRVAILVSCCLGILAPDFSAAQTPEGVVPITSSPDHKIRFDNGKVRMYELFLPEGKATVMHEHRADDFSVFFRASEITNVPYVGDPAVYKFPAGFVGFTSAAKGPHSHRVVVSAGSTFHVIALELLSQLPAGAAATAPRPGTAFKVALENSRGRAYRVVLAPGESTEPFTRPSGSAMFAISNGRISESAAGQPIRLWDFEPGHFRWIETGEKLSIRNEGSSPVDLVEIELF
jgi:mannose-6-phosphate isomerase-like protein (cupin superfamily)